MTDVSPVPQPGRGNAKSAVAFRTISEVAAQLDVPTHVLRFWETKFSQIHPLKRGGGRRYYRPEDIDLLRRIRELLYDDGYTIKGVQKLLREGGVRGLDVAVLRAGRGTVPPKPAGHTAKAAPGLDKRTRRDLEKTLDDLIALRGLLSGE